MDRIDGAAEAPNAASVPALPIAPQLPRRERRQFLTEIAIVVIGVLMALGAEQIVQWLNWQSEVKETRAALDKEIAYNIISRKLRHDQAGCIDRRLNDLQRWHDSWIAGKPLKPTAEISTIASRTILFDAWNVAQNGQVATHIPLEDRIRYASLYGFFRSFEDTKTAENLEWAALQKFEGAATLSARDLMDLKGLIINLRRANEARVRNWPLFVNTMSEFHIPIKELGLPSSARGLCTPMFGAAPGS